MNRTHLTLGPILLACAGLLAGCAPMSGRTRPDTAQFFASADTNHDGVVTHDELIAARAQKFTSMDRNGDGFIDQSDLPRRLRTRQNTGERISDLIAQFDIDGDGRVSRSEFTTGPTLAFDRADADHDGTLSADELATAKSTIRNHRSAAE